MKTRASLLAIVTISMAGCGGGGGDGGAPVERVYVVPHVLEGRGAVVRVAAGDVNGDGVPDIIALRESPTRGVTLQLSSGLRESPTKASLGKTSLRRGAEGYEAGVAHVFVWNTAADHGVADMDGDDRPDLVVAGGTAHQVGVWRCDPVFRDGFLSPVLADTSGSADRVAIGDVDGDGRPDLVTLDETTGQATVLLQTSSPPLAFAPSAIPVPAVGACHGLVLADMDRDGRLDLVTNDPAGDRIVFLDGGAAGFKLRESPTKQSTGRAWAVGDTDGDGWPDVVVVSEDGRSVVCLHQRPAEARVFDPVASPLPIAIDEPGVQVCEIAIGDPGVNGNRTAWGPDMEPDVARMGRPAINTLLTHYRTVSQPGLGLVDLDRDGRLDLVCAPEAALPLVGTASVIVFGSSTTAGGFGPTTKRATAIGRLSGASASDGGCVCIEDFDRDGHLDLLSADPDAGTLTLDYVLDPRFLDGSIPFPSDFAEDLRLASPSPVNDCATGDIDRDGFVDCVTATTTGLEIRFQDTAKPGTFLAPVVLAPGQDCRAVAIGDVNRDGCPDVVVAAGANGGTFLRDSLKPRSFLSVAPFPSAPQGTRFRSLALADLDRNGSLDLVAIRESPSKAYRCLGASSGFFDVFTEVSLGITLPEIILPADVDGDGAYDLVVAGSGPDGSCVVRQDPATALKFLPPTPLPLQRGVRVAAGDVNGDGVADVITSGDEGVAVALQSTDVPGRFLPAYALSREACGGLAIGDVNGDGQVDVCFIEVKTGTFACITGDPDFDLLRLVSLNGLPPGVPVRATMVVGTQLSTGDPDFDLLSVLPVGPGATSGFLSVWGSTHAKP
jgi:hypothetical protein